jgi:hypothetical protein
LRDGTEVDQDRDGKVSAQELASWLQKRASSAKQR